MGLQRAQRGPDAPVLAGDVGVDAGVLDDREQPRDQRAVLEQVEVALHRGGRRGGGRERAAVARGVRPLAAGEGGCEVRAGRAEVEAEGAELHAPALVGGVDLVALEVLALLREGADVGREVDGAALGGGDGLLDPADAGVDEILGGADRDLLAGEGLGVEPQRVADAAQLDAGGERLQYLLGARGLEAEVGLGALDVALLEEQVPAALEPAFELVRGEPREHDGRGAQEGHGRRGAAGGEAARELDEGLVVGGLDLREGLGGLDEERVALTADLRGDLGGELKEGAALVAVDRADQGGSALEVEARVGPGGVRDRGRELEEGAAVRGRERAEQLAGAFEAAGGELVGALGEAVDDVDEVADGVERERVQQHRALLEEGGGERDGLPVAVGEPLAERGPRADLLAGAADPLAHDAEVAAVGALQRLQHARRGVDEGGGDHRGALGELAGDHGPVEELLEGEGGDQPGRDAEVLAGRLPGAQRVAGQGDASGGPLVELLGREARLQGARAAGEVLRERGPEAVQLLGVARSELVGCAHRRPPTDCLGEWDRRKARR